MNVICRDGAVARDMRLRLWSDHLELPIAAIDRDPTHVFDEHWKPIAGEQLARRAAGQQLTHRLVGLPAVSKRSQRLLGPLQGLLVDG